MLSSFLLALNQQNVKEVITVKYTPMQLQRLKNGLSQEVASGKLGISRSYLSQLETTPNIATEEILYKMMKLYNCEKHELLFAQESTKC